MDILISTLDPIPVTAEQIRKRLEKRDIWREVKSIVHMPSPEIVMKAVTIDELVTPFPDNHFDGYRIGRIEDDIRGWHRYQEVYRSHGAAIGGYLWDPHASPLTIIVREFEKSVTEAVRRAMASPVYFNVETITCIYDPDFYIKLLKDSMTLEPKPRLFPPFTFPDTQTLADSARDFFPVPWKQGRDGDGTDELIEDENGFTITQRGERYNIEYQETFATKDEALAALVASLLWFKNLNNSEAYFFNPYVPSGGRNREEIEASKV